MINASYKGICVEFWRKNNTTLVYLLPLCGYEVQMNMYFFYLERKSIRFPTIWPSISYRIPLLVFSVSRKVNYYKSVLVWIASYS